MMLGAMGMDDLLPKSYLRLFSQDMQYKPTLKSAEAFKDLVNPYGYGSSFVREFKIENGWAFQGIFTELPNNKERYI